MASSATKTTKGRGGKTKGRKSPVDAHVGSRLRYLRSVTGISQEKLADALGITFQQVQKYESGANRIGASRLFDISQVLSTPINFFFDEFDAANVKAFPGVAAPKQAAYQVEPKITADINELLRAYNRIKDPKVRKSVVEMVRNLAKGEGGDQ
ncbi:MAG: helix-turn-helix domain-containing protein [Dongiaceae bacterium]